MECATASGSGLDPDISPAHAALQVDRLAQARSVSTYQVRKIIAAHTDGRALGFVGEPSVDVLAVNIALDQLPDDVTSCALRTRRTPRSWFSATHAGIAAVAYVSAIGPR